jgi:predicted esterase
VKNLQETTEEKWQFTSFAELQGVTRRTSGPTEVVLLLHGLGERGKRIFRKLLPHLPENALVIAPNGPFPIPRPKEGRMDYGHSWYFFDKSEQKYFINQDLAKFWLRDLLAIENPKHLPVTIIGFSQGGYLAPLAGLEIPETKLVIGIACEFRTTLIYKKLPFAIAAVHGENDEIISIASAKAESEALKKLDIHVDFHSLPGGHEITIEMGKLIKSLMES